MPQVQPAPRHHLSAILNSVVNRAKKPPEENPFIRRRKGPLDRGQGHLLFEWRNGGGSGIFLRMSKRKPA